MSPNFEAKIFSKLHEIKSPEDSGFWNKDSRPGTFRGAAFSTRAGLFSTGAWDGSENMPEELCRKRA
jgi:hypothetical protein